MTMFAALPRRLPLLVALLALALAVSLSRTTGEGHGQDALEGLRRTLASRHGLFVAKGEIDWEAEPPRGIAGAIVSVRAVALASRRRGGPRDLYRVEASLTPPGVPLSVSAPKNLTHTAVGDDGQLAVAPPYAAYSTTAYDQVQAVTILDLRGEPAPALAALDRVGRMQTAVTDFLATGDPLGVGRTVVSLPGPTSRVSLSWRRPAELAISWPGGSALVDARTGAVIEGAGVSTERAVQMPKPSILWTVDTVRSIVGPAPITWLEARTFALRDLGRRAMHGTLGRKAVALQPIAYRSRPAASEGVAWPPAPLVSDVDPREAGEGQWRPSAPAFVETLPGAPPAFHETFVRVDPSRPYNRVYVAAADLRQVDLGMVAGAEDPEPTVGPPGTGRLPMRAEVLDDLVAAFNGGFKSKHGNYGMVVERRVLLPPLRAAATITTHTDGRIGIGSWPADRRLPADLVSLRQNLDPLVDRGVLNPNGRRVWGFPLPEMESMETGRSGMCISRDGHLLYFYATDLSGPLLGRAMLLASCSYGIHLDMNPYHCSFLYARIHDPHAWLEYMQSPARAKLLGLPHGDELYDAQIMRRGMMDPRRYLVRSPKDFFYLVLRREKKPPGEALGWSARGLRQPAPAFLPTFHHGFHHAAAAGIELWSLARGRIAVRAGTSEPTAAIGATPPTRLELPEGHAPLLGLVAAGLRPGTGLVAAGRVVRRPRDGAPVLAMRAGGELAIGPWPVEGALEVIEGESIDAGAAGQGTAIGLDGTGRLTVATGAIGELDAALSRVGVTSRLLVARSDRAPRVDSSDIPLEGEERTVYLLAAPERPMAYRFDRDGGEL